VVLRSFTPVSIIHIEIVSNIKLQQKIHVKLPIPVIATGNNFGNKRGRKKELLERKIGIFKSIMLIPIHVLC